MTTGFNKILFVVVAALAALACRADSLYDPETFRSPVSDHKALKVGDKLTVLIYENASAQTSAGTTTEKTGGPSAKLQQPSGDKSFSLSMAEDFNGNGKIQRSGKLLGTITVIVQSVERNGDLNVQGEQLIEFNEEKQSIKLEGRVRPVDVQENNTIVSAKIANAKISYVGDGLLASRQHPGFLTRVLSFLGLL